MGWPGDLFLRSNITITIVNIVTFPRPSHCFVPLSAATSTRAPKFTLITPRRALFMRIFNVRPAATCIHHRTHLKSCKANLQKTLGSKKLQIVKHLPEKWTISQNFEGQNLLQDFVRKYDLFCPSSVFSNTGKYKYKFTNTGMSHSQRLPGPQTGCRM